MRFVAVIAGCVGALALAGMANDASAQTRARTPSVNLSEIAAQSSTTPATPAQRRGLRWNENGRWGLNFNLNQPVGREADWGDVEAGAYYRLSPRLRVGAAANLASDAGCKRAARRFLEEGDKVKMTLRFRGREMAHQELGMNLLKRVQDDTAEIAKVEAYPRLEGRQMLMVLAPK